MKYALAVLLSLVTWQGTMALVTWRNSFWWLICYLPTIAACQMVWWAANKETHDQHPAL